MVGCHHQLNGYEFEQTPGGNKGQGSLVCCSSQVAKNDWATEGQQKSIEESPVDQTSVLMACAALP